MSSGNETAAKVFWRLDGSEFFRESCPQLIVIAQVLVYVVPRGEYERQPYPDGSGRSMVVPDTYAPVPGASELDPWHFLLAVTDGFAADVIRQDFLPEFRQGRYGPGLLAGATRVINRIADFHDEMTAWRRDLHTHPETGFEERRTAALVAERLKAFGVDEVHTGLARTGVVGVLRAGGGSRDNAIGLRADMDALPIQEQFDHDYGSTVPGVMHACGHDTHMTMLIGAARLLKDAQSRGELPGGTIRLLFQPSEEAQDAENKSGAGRMIDEGALDGVNAVTWKADFPGGMLAVTPCWGLDAATTTTTNAQGQTVLPVDGGSSIPFPGPPGVTYPVGTVIDCGMQFDNLDSWSTTADPDPNSFDVQGVATHEGGHFIGVSHSTLGNFTASDTISATMLPVVAPGDANPRTLEEDDKAAILRVYARNRFSGAIPQTVGGRGLITLRLLKDGACVPATGVSVVAYRTQSGIDGANRVETFTGSQLRLVTPNQPFNGSAVLNVPPLSPGDKRTPAPAALPTPAGSPPDLRGWSERWGSERPSRCRRCRRPRNS